LFIGNAENSAGGVIDTDEVSVAVETLCSDGSMVEDDFVIIEQFAQLFSPG
jgi:hypothetical protein